MELLMSKQVKALVIVEGEKSEYAFFKSLESVYSLIFTICCLKTNIYALYKKMKDLDFNADIKQILSELHPEYADTLSQTFAYTYLVFDLDAHHTKKRDTRSINEIVMENVAIVKEMVHYFTDETDPSVGRLYINYPMLESFRDCDSPFDEKYRYEYVLLPEIPSFKQHVAGKQMVRRHLNRYTADDFEQIAKMNVYKLSTLNDKLWQSMPYSQYLICSQASNILDRQIALITTEGKLSVLNTAVYILIDYFGNQDGFYDKVVATDT